MLDAMPVKFSPQFFNSFDTLAPRFMSPNDEHTISYRLDSVPQRQLVAPGARCQIHRLNPYPNGDVNEWSESAVYGLIPSWACDTACSTQNCVIPIRSMLKKPAYRGALFKSQFCWASASFFVGSIWRDGKEHVVHVMRDDHEPLYLAGLWSEWKYDGEQSLLSFSLFARDLDDEHKALNFRIGHGLALTYVLLEASKRKEWLEQSLTSAPCFFQSNPNPRVCVQFLSTK